ncbi:MAG: folate family ECF transporter S component [Clostridiales bacterium]|jgi:ECF transporter S component (folate family)|nr:folate family ECF transporter S component [Clostridiales bacterium]
MNKKDNLSLAQQEIAPCQSPTDYSAGIGEYAPCGANANAAEFAEQNDGNSTKKTNFTQQNNSFSNQNASIQNASIQNAPIQNADSEVQIQNSGFQIQKTASEIQKTEFSTVTPRIQNAEFSNSGFQIQNKIQNADSKIKIQNRPPEPPKTAGRPLFRAMSARRLAYTAVLIAVSVIANGGAVSSPTSAVSFTYFSAFFAGTILGPAGGFLVGFLGDYIGCILVPKGPYMLLIGLSSGLMGLIPGLIMNLKPLERACSRLSAGRARLLKTCAVIASMILILLICTTCLNTLALFLRYSKLDHTFANWLVYLAARAPLQYPIVALNTAVIVFIFNALDGDIKNIKEKLNRKN